MAASIVGESSSSSPSSSKSSCTHHVFLSFRGDDTRNGFLSHLDSALELKGITAFKDDRLLQIGDDISHQLIRAIEESMFAIVLLSNNYANSTWCLNELQKIVECKDDKGLSIVPVFYDVDPSHVRHQKGSFEDAFKKHEGRLGSDSEKIQKWRDALTKVAGCSGWESKNMDEATLVESIAEDIFKKLIPKLPSSINNHVGILSKVEKVYSLLGLGLNDVRFIGIWGMGGIGKTTLARTVYEAIQADFKVSCFLSSVRERCDKDGIVQIQKDLVKCVHRSEDTFHNELDGRRVIQNSLCNKKVLLVIDDVNDAIQLENLAGSQNWFGPGSRIIIATRDLHLLTVHGVDESYKAEGLNENEAMHLFCLKTFKQDQPKEGYLELSKEVVKYCNGLPLALQVLGSYLCGRPISVWHSSIIKIKSVPHTKILDKLKISYDDLDSMERYVFLDIACFFKGEKKDYIIDILEKCDYNPRIEIEILIERSLITLDKDDRVEMHDLVEEMGKNIVIQESPNDPGKRSRLWSKDDINFVLTKNKGTEAAIQGIVFPFLYTGGCSMEAFSNMNKLKLLIMSDMELPHGLKLPSSLKVLRWGNCPLKTLPLADEQYELADITLQYGKLEHLWYGEKILEKLKNLNLYGCNELEQMPDLTGLPNLETLVLHSCTSITKVHSSLMKHKKLVVLDLSHCHKIRTFSGKLEMSSLKELILDSCTNLEDLPEFGECMKHLSRLILIYTGISKLPSSLGCLVGLEELDLSFTQIVCFPDTIQELKSLKILKFYGRKFLNKIPSSISHLPLLSSLNLEFCYLTEEDIPLDFCHFPSLTELDLSGNNFVSVPMNIHKLPKLRHLILNYCENLRYLPELPASIRELDVRGCYSLDKSEFNPLSKACNVFASSSSSQDHGEVVLQMMISGKEIPSWFIHKEDGNCVSVPPQHDVSDENGSLLGIALCFQIDLFLGGICLAVHNGNRSITNKRVSVSPREKRLYMIYLSNRYCINEEIHLDIPFQLVCDQEEDINVWSSAAGWIHKQDIIERFNKSEAEGGQKEVDGDTVVHLNENIQQISL